MKIIRAKHSSFCGGVRRAMRMALEAAGRPGGLAADGPLVHNRQALDLLALHGVTIADNPEQAGDAILIRAHGVEPERRRRWEASGKTVVDATCPHVGRNLHMAEAAAREGLAVVAAGDAEHAEMRALAGSAGPGFTVIANADEAERLHSDGNFLFLAQTTFNVETFKAIEAVLRRRFPSCRTADTICRATHTRQEEARRLAAKADVLVVVGGRHSANTRRLAEAGAETGKPVFHIETADELEARQFASFKSAAVISGASTPGWITQEAVNRLRFMGRPTFGDVALRCLHVLSESRALTAMSAFGFGLASSFFLNHALAFAPALAGACYIFFAHTINRRIPDDPAARRLTLADSFYQFHRQRLLPLAWAAAGISLALASSAGAAVLLLFVLALAAAIVFAGLARRRPVGDGRLRAANPLFRTLTMAAGWTLILGGPPAIASAQPLASLGVMAFIFLTRLGGAIIRDLEDIASDRLMGLDTIPARVGETEAVKAAEHCLGLAALTAFAAAIAEALGSDPSLPRIAFAVLAAGAPAFGLLVLEWLRKRALRDSVFLQAGVDAMGCAAGLLALVFGAAA